MREFAFSLVYEPGVDAYADALAAGETLRSESIVSCLDPEQFWRLELVTGDPEDLEELDPLLTDESLERETVSGRECPATRRHSLVEADAHHRVVYTHVDEARYCDAVPPVAARYLDGGTLFEAVRAGHESHWRVLMQDDEKVGMVYDTLTARLADGTSFRFHHLEDAAGWHNDLLASRSIRDDQRETLELAAERGYFETPREVTLDDIADELGVPRSTASYRLRRAVSELVSDYVGEGY
jgi:predicted DNA binding protein